MEKITSRRNPLCVHMKKLGESRSYRYERREYLCDGVKLLEDAVNSGASITSVLTSAQIPFPLPLDTRVYYTDRGVINSISPLSTAQDTLFTCAMPVSRYPDGGGTPSAARPTGDAVTDAGGACILLDSMQDPGNVGAIIRTANAFGIKAVILTGACADPYNPKAVRASMGAIFRQALCQMNIEELKALRDNGQRFIGATPDKNSTAITVAMLAGAVIVIGNEGRGLSDEVFSLCEETITIPLAPGTESLNAAVAAAIIIWETMRCHH